MSTEELKSTLYTYEEQLEQVNELLANEPGNSEYQTMIKELKEVIELTKDLIASTRQVDYSNFEEIPGRLSVGSKVQAVWSEDGEWYNGTIQSITPNGYMIKYDEWGNQEEVDTANVRQRAYLGDNIYEADTILEAERQAEMTRLALKRKIAQAADVDVISRDLPPKLKIKPDDPEDVKIAKKKKIHAFKSKIRLEQMEVSQNKRQNAWQQFQTSKGKSKKVGFFTGRKKESIFRSPDDPRGKVGVTGSGKGITEFQKREKHLHPKQGGESGDE